MKKMYVAMALTAIVDVDEETGKCVNVIKDNVKFRKSMDGTYWTEVDDENGDVQRSINEAFKMELSR